MWADEELVGKINFESIVCQNADIDKTFFSFWKMHLRRKEEKEENAHETHDQ